jgi:tetratricopeptide (TPR) repeat protein
LKEAERILSIAVDMEPKYVDALVWIGRTYEKLNKLEEAGIHYERAVTVMQKINVHAYFYYGVYCEKIKDFKKAIQLLKTCLNLDK